jgi:hypothetical protein
MLYSNEQTFRPFINASAVYVTYFGVASRQIKGITLGPLTGVRVLDLKQTVDRATTDALVEQANVLVHTGQKARRPPALPADSVQQDGSLCVAATQGQRAALGKEESRTHRGNDGSA